MGLDILMYFSKSRRFPPTHAPSYRLSLGRTFVRAPAATIDVNTSRRATCSYDAAATIARFRATYLCAAEERWQTIIVDKRLMS